MSELNLYQKIADVKANIDGFTKDTKGYNYTYVSGSQVLHRIRSKMIEHNLLLVPKT
ncbi:ERF family protein, partial [Staphylococcus pseudintermedius]